MSLSRRDELMAAVCARPGDDAPRLAMAEWFERRGGDPDRAAFIRAQCELARLNDDDDSASQAAFKFLLTKDHHTLRHFDWSAVDAGIARRVAVWVQAATLECRHRRRWKRAEAPADLGVSFKYLDRGFFSAATLRGFATLARRADELFARVPLRRLEIWDRPTEAQTRSLVEAGVLRRLEALGVYDAADVVRVLGEYADAAGVRELVCLDQRSVDRLARSLAASPHWKGLRTLDLTAGPLSARAAEELFRAPHLRGLRRLRVWGGRWPDSTARVLAGAGFTQLRELELFQCGLTDAAAEALANCPALRRLRTLSLATGRIGGAGASALLASPHLNRLAVLDLFQNPADGLSRARLQRPARPGSLRVLSLEGGRKRRGDLAALAECPNARGLFSLNLESNAVGDDAVALLAAAPPMPRLVSLGLLYNKIGDAGAAALAAWPGLAPVRYLHLNGNAIGPAGAQSLAESVHLSADVRHVCVDKAAVKAQGFKALRRRLGRAATAL